MGIIYQYIWIDISLICNQDTRPSGGLADGVEEEEEGEELQEEEEQQAEAGAGEGELRHHHGQAHAEGDGHHPHQAQLLGGLHPPAAPRHPARPRHKQSVTSSEEVQKQ